MGCPLMVLEDREDTISTIRDDLVERGYEPEVSTKPKTFNERLKAVPQDTCGYLIDNHIDKCKTLEAFGKPGVHTEQGSLAGYKIVSEVILPRMKAGDLPRRPIGVMSGRDLERAKSLFKHRFGTNAEVSNSVFFFRKEDSATDQSSEKHRYLEALQRRTPPLTRDQVALKMVARFQQVFKLSDDEMDRIFRVRGNTSMARQIALDRVQMASDSWEEMVGILFKIQVALKSVFSNAPDPAAAARRWLKRTKLPPKGETPLKLLLTGEFLSAYHVLDAVTFSVELH
jgi:hypothetical protein